MKFLKENKLFIAVVLLILIAGLYFFTTSVPIKYTVSRDYTGMEYTADMDVVSDSVKLHIYGDYYDYIWETRNHDYFRGKFEISSIPETSEHEAYFFTHDSYIEPNGNKKEGWMDYVMLHGFSGHIIMENRFSKMFIKLGDSYQNTILIFPAENHEQAAKVYNELESAIYEKDLFSERENKKDIVNRLLLTDGWELEENQNKVFSLLYQKNKVASITEIRNFAYGSNSQMIVSNWIGMHAFIAEETRITETVEDDRIDKVLINIEPSAVEEINGAKMVQELHYFYVASDNSFMDIILLDDDYVPELEKLLCGS